MITYGQLFQYVRPFFLARGGDSFASDPQLMTYSNMAIQDIYNQDEATFTYTNETIYVTKSGYDYVGHAENTIKKVEECFDQNGKSYVPTLYNFKNDDEIRWGGNQIIVPGRVINQYGGYQWQTVNEGMTHLEVCYIKDYDWRSLSELNELVPLPQRYIPALVKLMYDWAAPINMLAGETATTDFYAHAMARIKDLANNDGLTNSPRINTNRMLPGKLYK